MQQLEAIVLVPRIVGENLQLHPAIVILAVIWGGTSGGVLGVIIAPPIVASIRIILQYMYGRLTGREAFMSHDDEDELEQIGTNIQKAIQWIRERFSKRKQAPQANTESE